MAANAGTFASTATPATPIAGGLSTKEIGLPVDPRVILSGNSTPTQSKATAYCALGTTTAQAPT